MVLEGSWRRKDLSLIQWHLTPAGHSQRPSPSSLPALARSSLSACQNQEGILLVTPCPQPRPAGSPGAGSQLAHLDWKFQATCGPAVAQGDPNSFPDTLWAEPHLSQWYLKLTLGNADSFQDCSLLGFSSFSLRIVFRILIYSLLIANLLQIVNNSLY